MLGGGGIGGKCQKHAAQAHTSNESVLADDDGAAASLLLPLTDDARDAADAALRATTPPPRRAAAAACADADDGLRDDREGGTAGWVGGGSLEKVTCLSPPRVADGRSRPAEAGRTEPPRPLLIFLPFSRSCFCVKLRVAQWRGARGGLLTSTVPSLHW